LADSLNLVEACDRVADVPRVGQRLLALLGKRELRRAQLVLGMGRHRVSAPLRRLPGLAPRGRSLLGLPDVPASRGLLTLGRHVLLLLLAARSRGRELPRRAGGARHVPRGHRARVEIAESGAGTSGEVAYSVAHSTRGAA